MLSLGIFEVSNSIILVLPRVKMRESLHVLHPPGSHLDLGMRQRGGLSFKPLWRRRKVDETMRRLVQKRVDGNVLGCWTILSKI